MNSTLATIIELDNLEVNDDNDGELTDDSVKNLSDHRDCVRLQLILMEGGTWYGQALPMLEYYVVRATLVRLDSQLHSIVEEDQKLFSWWRDKIKVIDTFIQAQSAVPTCTLPVVPQTNVAMLSSWPCEKSVSETDEPAYAVTHQSSMTSV